MKSTRPPASSPWKTGAVRQSIGGHGPFRLRYRAAIGRYVQEVVQGRKSKLAASNRQAHSLPSVCLTIRAGGGVDGPSKFADEVAVIAEAGFNGDGGDGLVGFDEHLAGFSDAEFSHVGGGSELKGFLEVALKTAG